jgi:hypothetical protein
MDSFVVRTVLKRMSYRRTSLCLKGDKPRSSLLVHTCDHEVTGLKTYQGPKRKEQFGVPEAAVGAMTRPVPIAVGPVGQMRTGFNGLTRTETVSIWDTRIE